MPAARVKKIRRALVSVSDKTGLTELASFLAAQEIEILSTGGTLAALKKAGIPARPVEDFTGFPEILEGRVKTLHPKIHGGLLYRRDKKEHADQARKHGIEPIDLVIVNLYPFEQVTEGGADLEKAIENIDIGGPSMLRSAAKNFEAVTVVCDPSDYAALKSELEQNKGGVTEAFRRRLALKVFDRTASYDRAIAEFLKSQNGTHPKPEEGLPAAWDVRYKRFADLRYGENPHQQASLYLPPGRSQAFFRQLHGKELSYNNLLDIEAAADALAEFGDSAACVIKHNNPSGLAEAAECGAALEAAIECDAMSAFGGILGVNRKCTKKIAEIAFERLKFFEVFIAPAFDPDALAFLKQRPNLRVIEIPQNEPERYEMRFLRSGLLVQTKDLPLRLRLAEIEKKLRFVTRAKLSPEEIRDLLFAFRCAKIVKSNAIVITQGRQTVGIGAGQMSRIDSVELAGRKAGYRAEGSFMGSDAFFPMPDSIEAARDLKIRAVIQPGGSLRDADVIAACDRFGIAMAVTGERHFRH